MANNVENVSAGKPKIGGAVYRAPIGTTIPTDSTTALADGYSAMGYVSEDGVTNANSVNSDIIHAWGGDSVYTVTDENTDTFAATFIEATNTEVLKAYFGDSNVSGTLDGNAGITVTANGSPKTAAIWVIDMILKNNHVKRVVIPNGIVTETGDVVYVDDDVIGYPVTITAMPDASGNTHYEYIK